MDPGDKHGDGDGGDYGYNMKHPPPRGSYLNIWSHSMALFHKVVKLLAGRVLLEKVGAGMRFLKFYILSLLPVGSLLPVPSSCEVVRSPRYTCLPPWSHLALCLPLQGGLYSLKL